MENLSLASIHRAAASAMCWLLKVCVQPVALVAALVASQGAVAQNAERTGAVERQVKAAYLYKFASFVEWPEGTFARADGPFVIGVIGADALADELERIVAGQTVHSHPISVRKLRRTDLLAGLHVLFIGQLDKAQLAEVLAASKGKPMLTISESEDVYAMGSMINFIVVEDKLRFEVALKPVGISRLKISARMLSAAYKVVPGTS